MKRTLALMALSTCLATGTDDLVAADQAGPKPPLPLSPAASVRHLRLPEGFRVELVASEPLVVEPSCIVFDERGRMFVSEIHGFNLEGEIDVAELNKSGKIDRTVRRIRWERVGGRIAEQARQGQFGTVKLLVDSDGDGRMDKAHVWADRLPPCYGMLPSRDGLVVVCAPDILFLADRDGDGRAEVRETLLTGFRREFIERGINNPRWGLDNWIYVGSGGDGGTIRGPRLKTPVKLGRTDFRIRPDGSAIEPVTGTVRTFGWGMNAIGDRFTTAGGTPVSANLPLPYRYLGRNPFVASPAVAYTASNYNRVFGISPPHPWRVVRGRDPNWVKFYGRRETSGGYFTSGCGTEIYQGRLFPREMVGQLFCCEPSNNVIHRSSLTLDGAVYRARRTASEARSEFLASTDPWFRPVNLRVGPDGAMYIVDMYREIVEDYSAIPRFLQQRYGLSGGRKLGRIWRLIPEKTRLRPKIDWQTASNRVLLEALRDENAWRRFTAQRMLIDRGGRTAAGGLAKMVRNGRSPAGRLHALYTLDGLGVLQPAEIIAALADSDPGMRIHALQLSEKVLPDNADTIRRVAQLATAPQPRVRLQVALTLGESQLASADSALLELARRFGHEQWMPAAVLSGARDRAGRLLASLLSGKTVGRGGRELIGPLAATLAAGRRASEWTAVLDAVAPHDVAVKTVCLKGLASGLADNTKKLEGVEPMWTALARLVADRSPPIRHLSIGLAARLGFGNRPAIRREMAQAMTLAQDVEVAIPDRIAAVRLLAFMSFDQAAATFGKLLDSGQPLTVQLAAVGAMNATVGRKPVLEMLKGWSRYTPRLRKDVLDAVMSREDRLPVLVDALENKTVAVAQMNASRRERLMAARDPKVASRARRLFAERPLEAELRARVARYQKALKGKRNLKQGREVFVRHCLACHRLKKEGHAVGPDLGSVVKKPDEALLLEFLNPSATIEPAYQSYTVVTSAGRIFTGTMAAESATSLTLRKEKGMTDTVLRKEIESVKASAVSLMPSNLYEKINPTEIADAIAYLRQALSQP
jgi:putative membrane-bound dehydrogenase-like protein